MGIFDQLSTGNSAVTFGNEEPDESQQEVVETQARELAELLPSIKSVLATIDAEIAAVSDIRAYMKTLGNRPTKAQLEQEYAARELFITMAERLKLNIANRVSDVEASDG